MADTLLLPNEHCLKVFEGVNGTEGNDFSIWDLMKGSELSQLELDAEELARRDDGIDLSYRCRWWRLTPDSKYVISASMENAVTVRSTLAGKILAKFISQYPFSSLAVGPRQCIAAGDGSGRIYLFRLLGIEPSAAVATAVRLWKPRSLNDKGEWDTRLTAKCEWCGSRCVVSSKVLDTILGITRSANLSEEDSPYLELDSKAWDEIGLLDECPHCGLPLRFNPFAVDNCDLYDN